ncbi:MarR family transcriptional regulator [Streptomyces sp. NPDC046821]|uniref:MarR family winged helix-turn-helix transcriptional regulator n=1 Tax=Streptomyces sp. NPDC046821 TaxID=3154702 RepID=UPI0033D9A27C
MSKREQDDAIADVERAMVAIRRRQTRRSLARLTPPGGGGPIDPTLFNVLDVIDDHDKPCSVRDVATALSVDQPRASRLVLRTVEEGWLDRRTDPSDARRTLLALTGSGREQLDRAHRFRQEIFARVMADWSDVDRSEFARLITAFVTSFAQVVPDAE